jgi:hypothetical protein
MLEDLTPSKGWVYTDSEILILILTCETWGVFTWLCGTKGV